MIMMKRLFYNFAAFALFHFFIFSFSHCSALFAQASWVAYDALGRALPSAEECPLKTDKPRTVGIFYITWHTPDHHDGQSYTYDVTKRIEADSLCTRGIPTSHTPPIIGASRNTATSLAKTITYASTTSRCWQMRVSMSSSWTSRTQYAIGTSGKCFSKQCRK